MQLLNESNTTSTVTGSATNAKQSEQGRKMDYFYPPKPKVSSFNDLFTCQLCQGYMINPTTIDVCMHTYCRSCIVGHLAAHSHCPQCQRSAGGGGGSGKALTISNLKSDDVLRSIIFKLVPALYQKERERIVKFVNNTKTNRASSPAEARSAEETLECDDDFFLPTDRISLSLEYHPYLANQCPEAAVPPVRYLQCPAGVKIQHLKRFLCSKFDIDPCNRKVGIEIIYEDEVLPPDFTLMDVGYCYQWKRNAPLKFFYRILIYSEEPSNKVESGHIAEDKVSEKSSSSTYLVSAVPSPESDKTNAKSAISLNGNDGDANSTFPFLPPAPLTTKLKCNKTSATSKHVQSSSSNHPVKMTITSRPAESKKSVSKRSSATEDFALPTTNDFKSLRSNDIRYSHYTVTASTTSSTTSSSSSPTTAKVKVKASEKAAKCDIVVSIPHNQMHDEWDSKPLSQLKTASKKSPNPPAGSVTSAINIVDSSSVESVKKVKNVPKLKIELNSLKTKLIEKPKSADIRLDTLMLKQHKPRKFSLDEPQLSNDKVDLETYVKNIGLKPIEVQTNAATPDAEMADKFTPNASPRSSCSSSTTSSSNGYLHLGGDISTSSSSSSSHKKRKKKHSKEPRDSKRKKLHAEISSHAADESLKMKVKLTAPLNIKPSKLESKKSPDPLCAIDKAKSPDTKTKVTFEKPILPAIVPRDVDKDKYHTSKDKSKSSSEKRLKETMKLKPLAIKTTSKDFEDDDDILMPDTTTTTSLSFSKPLANLKDSKLPHSPPLPPSLFKTTPITFSTFSPNAVAVPKTKPPVLTPAKAHSKEKPIQPTKMKPLAPKPMPVKHFPAPMKPPQFAVPNLPRLMASTSSKFTSTPSSIASAANKQMGNLLKRSASLDEAKAGAMAKQLKLEKPHQITVSAYGSNLQVTRVEVPATPTSSTAKATFEIPLYSPLSASYNPKCSFTVGSSSSCTGKSPKVPLPISPSSTSNPQLFTTGAGLRSPENDPVKITPSCTIPNTNSLSCFGANKTSTLMGPPLAVAKLNAVVPTTVKSPPLGSVLSLTPSKPHSQSVASSQALLSSRSFMTQSSPSQSLPEKKPEVSATPSKTINGPTSAEKPKSSLRQFRLPSRDSGQDILDLSPAPKSTSANGLQAAEKKPTPTVSIPASTATTTGSSLELALTKIKQNITNSGNLDSRTNTLDMKPNSDDLQNLHLLSESATAREKIAISHSPTSSASTSSLYEKPKINQNSLVRQQNASVRSIPNPSALAFRNLQPANNIPMVTIAAPLLASLSNDVDKPLLLKQPSSPHSPLSSGMPQSPINCSTSSTSPTRTTTTTTATSTLSSKRHPSIDQVAASLNIRASAAAAAEASAKANLKQLDEAAIVTSTSSSAETSAGNKVKQIKQETVEQTTTHVQCLPATSTEMVEIKKEPEDRLNESSLADEVRDVRAAFATTSSTSALAMPPSAAPTPASSKAENLVTSVINVTTPTSTLLTASSSAGF